jgi:hypothetical protein
MLSIKYKRTPESIANREIFTAAHVPTTRDMANDAQIDQSGLRR